DPADPGIRLDIGLAQDKLSARETVSAMIRRTGARVGINGGYFATSGGPLGLVVKDGRVLAPHVGRRPPRTAMGLTRDRQVKISRVAARGQQLVGVDGSVWSDIVLALGGGPQLVYRGVVALTTDEEALGPRGNDITRVAGRTAVAVTRDGKMLLVTAAGYRDTHTQGLRLESLANRLLRRGASQAMNLDGGASVDMVIGNHVVSAGPGSTTREKPVATALLVFDSNPSTAPERIRLDLDNSTLAADGVATTRAMATVLDGSGNPVPDGTPVRFWSERLAQSAFAITTKAGVASVELRSVRHPGPAGLRVECGGARAEEGMRLTPGSPNRLAAGFVSSQFLFPDKQEATLVVQVDDAWGNALPGASVRVEGQPFQAAADGTARLAVELPLAGGTVQVEADGLPPVSVPVPRMEPPAQPAVPTNPQGRSSNRP
ncbi:MAG: phosphodiester glycosidase family protein, partial [Candidatus Eremiobacterota bacterium]